MASGLHVHHLNCAHFTRTKLGGKPLACHVLLVETPNSGLVLVDTGLGTADYAAMSSRLGRLFPLVAQPDDTPSLAAIEQITKLGHRPDEVRHIIQTHLDVDHVGGLADFPHASVHVFASELGAALAPRGIKGRFRYRPAMWAHNPAFQIYTGAGDRWLDFEAVRQLNGLPPEILLIPLAGHTVGQCGVAIDSDQGWLLHAGDAYFDPREVHQPRPQCALSLRLLQLLVTTKYRLRAANQARLRQLIADNPDIMVFSAHDPAGFPPRAAGRVPPLPGPITPP